MNAVVLGVSAARSRLGPRFWLALSCAAFAAVFLAAMVLRRTAPSRAVDETLSGVVFGWCIPLAAYAAVARACRQGRLDDALWPLARFGVDRRASGFGFLLGTGVTVAILSSALAAVGLVFAAGKLDAPIVRDALVASWIAALGGAIYVAWFALGSLVGKKGGGRFAGLAIDWVFGSASSAIAVPWPRAHLRSLLGGDLVFFMSERQSTAALYALLVSYLALCFLRLPN